MANVRTLVVRLVVVAGMSAVMLSACGGGSSSPSASKATTTTQSAFSKVAETALLKGWVTAKIAESTANQTSTNTAALIIADVTKQTQRVQQDQTTVRQNQFGLGCNAADYSTYGSCVQSEEQTAAAAQNDEAAANSQIQTDYQQYATESSTFEAALSTFISQIADLSWPSSMQSTLANLITAAKAVRTDYGYQAAVNSSTPQSTTSQIQAQASMDIGSFNDAVSAVNADLLHLFG